MMNGMAENGGLPEDATIAMNYRFACQSLISDGLLGDEAAHAVSDWVWVFGMKPGWRVSSCQPFSHHVTECGCTNHACYDVTLD